jgi:hypothetical protein
MQEYYDLRQGLLRREKPLKKSASGLINGKQEANPNKMPRAGATQPRQARGISNLSLETIFTILGIL